MEKFHLSATERDVNEKLTVLRANKRVPAVVYGHNITSQTISMAYSDFLKVERKAGKTHIIELTVGKKTQKVLVYDLQFHPVSGDFLHVDFLAVSAHDKITLDIPLVLVGVSKAQKEGGVLQQYLDTVEVRCLPDDIPEHFEVDISKLEKIDDIVHIEDLGIDTKKFDIETPLTEAVVTVYTPEEIIEETGAPELVLPVEEAKEEEKGE